MNTITDRDVRAQVQRATDACDGEYDVEAITETIVYEFGSVDIERIPYRVFWGIVERYSL